MPAQKLLQEPGAKCESGLTALLQNEVAGAGKLETLLKYCRKSWRIVKQEIRSKRQLNDG